MSTQAATGRWRVLAACAGVAAVVLLLAAAVAALTPRASPPTFSHPGYARIEVGMTEPEVEALLGGPRGVYDPRFLGRFTTAYGFGPGGHSSVWLFPGCEITVTFGPGGGALAKRIGPPPPAGPAAQAWRWGAEAVRERWPW